MLSVRGAIKPTKFVRPSGAGNAKYRSRVARIRNTNKRFQELFSARTYTTVNPIENLNSNSTRPVIVEGKSPRVALYDPKEEKDSCGVGLVANVKGKKSHEMVEEAITLLTRLAHRSAYVEKDLGDGVGMQVAIPDEFFQFVVKKAESFVLPAKGKYGVGNVFFNSSKNVKQMREYVEHAAQDEGLKVIGWRTIPTNPKILNRIAKMMEPLIEQVFISCPSDMESDEFERKLYIIDRQCANAHPIEDMHFCSLSSRVIVYKGLLTAEQFRPYFLDLHDPLFQSHYALVHARFSTNTFPIWQRAQPCRLIAHNGEINTLQGNIRYMESREGLMNSPLFGNSLNKLFPIINPEGSDSFMFDNTLQFLTMSGRSLPEAICTMIPEAWQNKPAPTGDSIEADKRAFYEYSSSVMEPWDGPAMMSFSDSRYAGACLDRNGLRPGRIWETTDDTVILCSESGVISLDPSKIRRKYRLEPGKIFLIDFDKGEILSDEDVKKSIVRRHPYKEWLQNKIAMSSLTGTNTAFHHPSSVTDLMHDPKLRLFDYSIETVTNLYTMAKDGEEVLGSMGNDEALAVLSDNHRIIYDFFVGLFAQVTNPPIDPIREAVVMSLKCFIGPEQNMLTFSGKHCQRMLLESPILDDAQRDVFDNFSRHNLPWTTFYVDCTMDANTQDHRESFVTRLNELCEEASNAIKSGHAFIVITDRRAEKDTSRVPLSSLLVTGAIHQHLVKTKHRSKVGIVVETAEARETHHFTILLGYGADAIYPYLAYDIIRTSAREDRTNAETVLEKYRTGASKGILKVMSKMGISALQSYKGAQLFEIIGLSHIVVDKCFTGTPSRISGLTFDHLADFAIRRYRLANSPSASELLYNSGNIHWRADGEMHTHEPRTIAKLQEAVREHSKSAYQTFTTRADEQSEKCNLRGLLDFKKRRTPISLDEVESAEEIVKRFCTGAMSYGSISIEAHETLAIAMNRIGAKSNTGEGGENYHRFKPLATGDSARSAIKQVASGRFGVTSYYLSDATDIQIKMAQGAKPGEGGELPGYKVTEDIAATRHSTPGVGLISPPPHHDIYSIEDLAQLIHDLKNANPKARISVKLVSRVGVGVVAAGVAKCRAEHLVIAGNEGGTGAARWSSIKNTGSPWELGLAEAHQTLVLNGLRGRVRLQVDGGLKTGRDVVLAALLGAEEFGFGTVPLVALGCIMMRKCHLNTCPVGIATQDPILRAKFTGQPEHVINYFFFLAEEVRGYMAAMGFKTMEEMVGRTDYLYIHNPKRVEERGIDLSPILQTASTLNTGALLTQSEGQIFNLEKVVDQYLLSKCMPTLLRATTGVSLELPIDNGDRSVGTMLSHEITNRYGVEGLPEDSIKLKFKGSAGQSFGAWVTKGVTLHLEGDANDYVGKGLCGGKIIVHPHLASPFRAEQNVIVGNAVLYGATSGQAFFCGIAGDRFAVRNSGVEAVIEGAGAHCCEYMTGGRVVVLGNVGSNFAAGMSGGIAFVWCPTPEAKEKFEKNCNMATISLESVNDVEAIKLYELVKLHHQYTNSRVAGGILSNWQVTFHQFVQVLPKEYKAVLEEQVRKREAELRQEQTRPPQIKIPSKMFTVEEIKKQQRESQRRRQQQVFVDNSNVVPGTQHQKTHGFFLFGGKSAPYKPVQERVKDWQEIYSHHSPDEQKRQAARCMDCGVPFCQSETGCPIHNHIPEWINFVYKDKMRDAYESLSKTNNFPEFTGRVCPAPCEGACVLGVTEKPVTIKNFEQLIIDKAFEEGWVQPYKPKRRTGKRVAVVGSGPAGLAAADQLNRAGHQVSVYERDDRIGGLLVYGIPSMKLGKSIVQQRVNIMAQSGINFLTNTLVNHENFNSIRSEYDSLLLAVGATQNKELPLPGRKLKGIYPAMQYLNSTIQYLDENGNLLADESTPGYISAKDKSVIVIGGGDTAADCIGTAIRQGCKQLVSFEIMPKPPNARLDNNPWPEWPRVFRVEYAHAEAQNKFGKDPRKYFISPEEFVCEDGSGHVTGVRTVSMRWQKFDGKYFMTQDPGTDKLWEADLVLLAIGFSGPDEHLSNIALPDGQKLKHNPDSTYSAAYGDFQTTLKGVYAAGDCRRGQSLVVWAINEGRIAAAEIDKYLEGSTELPGIAKGKALCHPVIFDKSISKGHRLPLQLMENND